MLKVYTYECNGCQMPADLLVEDNEKDYQSCEECGEEMHRLPVAPMCIWKFNDTKLKK